MLVCWLTMAGLGLDGDAVSKNNFPLPMLRVALEHTCRDVHEGIGFAIVRGLCPDNYTAEDNLNFHLGISSYIGDVRGVQDRQGSMISAYHPTFADRSSLNL